MILDYFSLAGMSGIVTGASKGIGEGLARGLAEAGADVLIISRNSRELEETARNLRRNTGQTVITLPLDLKEEASWGMVADGAMKEFGKIDFLINNAGTVRRTPSELHSVQEWDEVLDLNLKSVFFVSQKVANHMIPRDWGRIVNVASLMCLIGGMNVPSYAASKGGVGQLTKAMANDFAKYGINVNAIAPGYIATSANETLRQDPKRGPQILSRIPKGRYGEPYDLAGLAVFLCSKASEYVTGQVIYADGGWTGY